MNLATPSLQELAEKLARLVSEGGRIALGYHGKLQRVAAKADDSPLTEADLAVDRHLCEALLREFSGIPVVTEERVSSHLQDRKLDRFFLVDPIDGTREFVAERGEFTVNIGLVVQGVPVAGAVCAPAIGKVYYGAIDLGAFETDLEAGSPRHLAPARSDNSALRVVASRSHRDPITQSFIDANPVASCIAAGSSLKFCQLAAGEADLYPRFGPTMEWDTAAGHAVLSAAGGIVEEISGASLKYGKADYRNGAFIAYTPGTKFKIP